MLLYLLKQHSLGLVYGNFNIKQEIRGIHQLTFSVCIYTSYALLHQHQFAVYHLQAVHSADCG